MCLINLLQVQKYWSKSKPLLEVKILYPLNSHPSLQPSSQPTCTPLSQCPSRQPSTQPSQLPTSQPSSGPSYFESNAAWFERVISRELDDMGDPDIQFRIALNWSFLSYSVKDTTVASTCDKWNSYIDAVHSQMTYRVNLDSITLKVLNHTNLMNRDTFITYSCNDKPTLNRKLVLASSFLENDFFYFIRALYFNRCR